MTPIFKIEANGKDVTAALQADIVSIAFSDEDGNQSDEITIKVAGDFTRPKYEDELRLWLGHKETSLFFCGAFLVQTTERDRSGVTITATAADFSSALKAKRDTSYEELSIKDVAAMIADRHALKLKSDYDDLSVTHISQTKESDMAFLKRLASEYNGIFSIKNGTLVLLKRIEGEKASDTLPVYTLSADEVTSMSIKHANKTLYLSCTASWQDTKENEAKSITVGSGDPILKLDGNFKTAAEAQAKAEAKLQKSNRGTRSGSISMYGKEIYAGGILRLSGAGEDNGDYSIKTVSHNFSKGWTMSIEIEK